MDGKQISNLINNQLHVVVFSDGTSKQIYVTD